MSIVQASMQPRGDGFGQGITKTLEGADDA